MNPIISYINKSIAENNKSISDILKDDIITQNADIEIMTLNRINIELSYLKDYINRSDFWDMRLKDWIIQY